MTDFRLASIDWGSVRLLHADHLHGETSYLEELARWVLLHTTGPGVAYMGPDALTMLGSSPTTYRLTLRRFAAVTAGGYWIQIGDDEDNPTLDLDRQHHLDSVVSICVGVDTRAKESREHAPGRSSALLECRSLWPRYALGIGDSLDGCDCLKIAELVNDAGNLVLNTGLIPDCIHLDSHPALVDAVREITNLANDGLQRLASLPANVREIAAQFAVALAPGSVLVDWRVHPRAYLDRMGGVLQANLLVAQLCQDNSPHLPTVIHLVNEALKYLHQSDGHGPWLGPALQKIGDALRELLLLYPAMKVQQAPAAQPDSPQFKTIDGREVIRGS